MALSLRLAGRCISGVARYVTPPGFNGVKTSLIGVCRPVGVTIPSIDQRRHYAMRLELTEHGIVWRRPNYVPSWQPEKSGDLEGVKEPEVSTACMKVQPAKDVLDQVDEVTRRLLSIEFGNHKENMKVQRYNLCKKVQRHQYDTGSMEVAIAMLTVKIRNLQKETFKCKKNTLQRCYLQELIDRRKKMLKHLRRMDYKRFEWLIEELKIIYRPPPRYYRWITRKASLKKLVRMHKREIVHRKLNEYKESLELQKEPFLREKEETLKWIAETERSLGVPVSVAVPEAASSPS
ncbi:28S ribosomal protein S15, mitochondrial-like [Penaeus japonicus]|uniref:28S ribosomal protein S15, mitochondrial-like n=1 Tax=Penaeus japonicus TaxID=27405 RepID=UPI001C70DA2D|nr:28S ribosomal protein S15, mitochondrial-like [Penaeus japonicus]